MPRTQQITCSSPAAFPLSSSFSRNTLSADCFRSSCFFLSFSICDLSSEFSKVAATLPLALLFNCSSTSFARWYSFRKNSSEGCSHEDAPFSSWKKYLWAHAVETRHELLLHHTALYIVWFFVQIYMSRGKGGHDGLSRVAFAVLMCGPAFWHRCFESQSAYPQQVLHQNIFTLCV